MCTGDQRKLKNQLRNNQLAISFDESFDKEGRYVSCILLTVISEDFRLEPILAATLFEQKALNAARVSQLVLKTISEYAIDFDKVLCFSSDNASYMLSTYNIVVLPMRAVLPNSQHLPWNSDIMNLILKTFTISFQRLYRWCHEISASFSKNGARKQRFVTFAKNIGFNSIMPPAPNVTRWTSLFEAIEYHAENLYVEKTF